VEYRRLGDSGPTVSAVGLGTNNFASRLDDDAAGAVLNQSMELGVTFIDTADIYGRGSDEGLGASESQLGRLLAGRRDRFVVATKFGFPMSDSPKERGASRRWVVTEVENSLRRLQTDYIDLYQVHAPDAGTPIEETLRALDDLVRAGKVRHIGHSNFAAWQIADADWTALTAHLVRPVSAEMHYNLLFRDIQAEVIPACRAFGLGIIPYFPLESGFLTGKYRRDGQGRGRLSESARAARILTPANFERIEAFEQFAAASGHSLLDLAFGWLLSQPIVGPVIASASTPDQVRANVAAAEWRLSAAELEAVAALQTDPGARTGGGAAGPGPGGGAAGPGPGGGAAGPGPGGGAAGPGPGGGAAGPGPGGAAAGRRVGHQGRGARRSERP
jgi:aryl-alcohol dehydrogenase-like predicted oxidoreductase